MDRMLSAVRPLLYITKQISKANAKEIKETVTAMMIFITSLEVKPLLKSDGLLVLF